MQTISYITAALASILGVHAALKAYHFVQRVRSSPAMHGPNLMPGKPDVPAGASLPRQPITDEVLDSPTTHVAAIRQGSGDVLKQLNEQYAGVEDAGRRRLAIAGVLLHAMLENAKGVDSYGETLGMGITSQSAFDVLLGNLHDKMEKFSPRNAQPSKTMDTDVDEAMHEAAAARERGQMN